MRTDVEFQGFGGCVLRGWYYRPDDCDEPVPGVVMAHGFSGVKEQHLGDFAEVFVDAGLAVLVYDHRNFGSSAGDPRQLINPWAQTRDYRVALDWLAARPEVDPEHLALWGTSFSGGEVVVLGAIDERVSAVVANVPFTGYPGVDYTADGERFDQMRRALADETGEGPADSGDVIGPIVLIEEEGHEGPVMFAGTDAARLFLDLPSDAMSTWQNQVWVQNAFSGDPPWDPGYAFAQLRAPLLMVVAGQDTVALADVTLAAGERAAGPTQLVVMDCPHFEAYTGDWFTMSSTAMRAFLLEHLVP